METYTIKEDIPVFCLLVPDFPIGIQGAFNGLVKQFGNEGRAYYGVSYMDEQCRIVYKAPVSAKEGEEAKYDYEQFSIQSGEYLCEELTDWMQKTGEIKNILAA